MAKKAEAWQDYQSAAMVDMVLETLPKVYITYMLNIKTTSINHLIWLSQVAAEVAAPLSQTKKIVMIAGDKGELGASKITSEVLDIISKLPKAVEDLTGVDISAVRLVNIAL